jgi:hypothetical protein
MIGCAGDAAFLCAVRGICDAAASVRDAAVAAGTRLLNAFLYGLTIALIGIWAILYAVRAIWSAVAKVASAVTKVAKFFASLPSKAPWADRDAAPNDRASPWTDIKKGYFDSVSRHNRLERSSDGYSVTIVLFCSSIGKGGTSLLAGALGKIMKAVSDIVCGFVKAVSDFVRRFKTDGASLEHPCTASTGHASSVGKAGTKAVSDIVCGFNKKAVSDFVCRFFEMCAIAVPVLLVLCGIDFLLVLPTTSAVAGPPLTRKQRRKLSRMQRKAEKARRVAFTPDPLSEFDFGISMEPDHFCPAST